MKFYDAANKKKKSRNQFEWTLIVALAWAYKKGDLIFVNLRKSFSKEAKYLGLKIIFRIQFSGLTFNLLSGPYF